MEDRSRTWPLQCLVLAFAIQAYLAWGIVHGELKEHLPSTIFFTAAFFYMAVLGNLACSLYQHLWLKRRPRTWQEWAAVFFWLFTGAPLMLAHVLVAAQFPRSTLGATLGIDIIALCVAISLGVTGTDLPEVAS